MCGIIGAVSSRDVVDNLLNGLQRLEYRGYDSTGIAVLNSKQELQYHRVVGKVNILSRQLTQHALVGNIGIAHNRWATHGKPSEKNAHPQCANHDIAVVHNGIIENYLAIKETLVAQNIPFFSETDSEILPWLFYQQLQTDLDPLKAVQGIIPLLKGAFSMLFLSRYDPSCLIAVRQSSPLVIGLGHHENFLASDKIALLPFTQHFIYLEDGDYAIVHAEKIAIYDQQGQLQNRPIHSTLLPIYPLHKGSYAHYMQKEIQEQPSVLQSGLNHYITNETISLESLQIALPDIRQIHLTACGSSYHAALVGRFWIEQLTGIPCQVEIASEFRYRHSPILPHTLLITLSQSGETADTLGALRAAKQRGTYEATLTICNMPESSIGRESDWVIPTHAGIEIGVAATKSFLTQLNALLVLAMALEYRTQYNPALYRSLIEALPELPTLIKSALPIEDYMIPLAKKWRDTQQGLLIARGMHYPIALEGALKLKETTYIHVEACPAGELKHGTLALVTDKLPIIVLAPDDAQLSKMQSNIQEILTRGGQLLIFAGENLTIESTPQVEIIRLPNGTSPYFSPFIYTIPLQYLAYHIAHLKGINVDQPRYLAKSVTVE
jgi:glucosamine--fructose-6-phosphate aminotransferase (isomerizing)